MKYLIKHLLIAIVFLFVSSITLEAQPVRGNYLYTLSNFTGPIPYSWPRVVVDEKRNEIYVLYQNFIRVFNENGMEIYRFGDDLDLGHIVDVAIDWDGNIFLLSYKDKGSGQGNELTVTMCDYRGEPRSEIELKNLPPEFSAFGPNRMIFHKDSLYFASQSTLLVVVTDTNGVFKKGYDILPLLELDEKEKQGAQMVGFSVDKNGNILFTIPPLFRAYKLSPNKELSIFGKPGGAPGKFNIVSGIVSDSKGNIVVVDKLKCSIMVYDKKFNFLTQFATRGYRRENLIAPDDIAIDKNDRIYVTQSNKRGVNVYRLSYN